MDKLISFLEAIDFAKGWKTISGIVVMILSLIAVYKNVDVNVDVLNTTLVDIGIGFGSLLTAFGIIMKGVRVLIKLFKK